MEIQDTLIPYRPFAAWEDWLKQRLASIGKTRTAFKLISSSIFLFCLITVLAVFGSAIWAALGGQAATAADYAATAALNQLIISCFGSAAGLAIGLGMCSYFSQPTHLRLSSYGAKVVSKHGPLILNRRQLTWNEVSSVVLASRITGSTFSDQELLFFGGSKLLMKINIPAISAFEDRAVLREQIESQMPFAIADASVLQALEPPKQQAYTELWLQALAAPAGKLSLLPLMQKMCLNDGKYEIMQTLASGGQGTAYLAKNLKGEEVVLKEFLMPVHVDIHVRRQSLKSFENEARILQQISHPGIVELLDFFAEDQRVYLVFAYINGRNLREKIRESGPLNEKTVLALAVQICDIVDYLHNMLPPVVHRDISPDNLMLMPDDTLKLIDFNVAQQCVPGTSGSVVGKPAYVAPEQFRGEACPQSDIYSLGATLHYLLTACDPEPITSSHPALLRADLTGEFDLIIANATNLDLDGRYKNMDSLKAALLGIQSRAQGLI